MGIHFSATDAAANPALALPFVRELNNEDGDLDYWVVESTGDTSCDFALGRSYAEQVIAVARATNNPMLIQSIVRAICLADPHGHGLCAIAGGFLNTIFGSALRAPVLSPNGVVTAWLPPRPQPVAA